MAWISMGLLRSIATTTYLDIFSMTAVLYAGFVLSAKTFKTSLQSLSTVLVSVSVSSEIFLTIVFTLTNCSVEYHLLAELDKSAEFLFVSVLVIGI